MKYHIEESTSKTGWPVKTLVFETDTLVDSKVAQDSFRRAFEILSKLDKELNEEHHFNIQLRLSGGITLSEKTLWSIVFDSTGDDYRSLIEYIDCWCNITNIEEYETLPRTDEYHFIGETAFLLFFERYFDADESLTQSAMPLYHCFNRFIQRCDLDHETHQDELIQKVLLKLRWLDTPLYCELLCYRLNNGQVSYFDSGCRGVKPFLAVGKGGKMLLKPIIDFLIDHNEDHRFLLEPDDSETFSYLIAAVYGSNEPQTNEIIAYIEQRISRKLRPLRPYAKEKLAGFKAECDAMVLGARVHESITDSGFHVFDWQIKEWQPYKQV